MLLLDLVRAGRGKSFCIGRLDRPQQAVAHLSSSVSRPLPQSRSRPVAAHAIEPGCDPAPPDMRKRMRSSGYRSQSRRYHARRARSASRRSRAVDRLHRQHGNAEQAVGIGRRVLFLPAGTEAARHIMAASCDPRPALLPPRFGPRKDAVEMMMPQGSNPRPAMRRPASYIFPQGKQLGHVAADMDDV